MTTAERPRARVSLRNVREVTSAALENERTTRERVAALEQWAETVSRPYTAATAWVEELQARSVWGRLRWLLTGR